MHRSSFSTNPLLRVSRPVSACSRCRSAKVKCDGKLPACTACEKAGRGNACSSANDQFARGKERSYVAALELRIEKLERRLAFAKASVSQHESDVLLKAESDVEERKGSLANIKAAIDRKAARKLEKQDLDALVSDFGYLSVNATARDFDPDANMSFARLVMAAAANDPLPDAGDWSLPPREEAVALLQHYVTNIYCLFPAFPEMTLYALLDQLYVQQSPTISDSEYWLVYMVLALGSTAQSRSISDEYYINGVYFVSKAMQFARIALIPGSVTQIQSLILLTQYSMLDPAHFDSWHLIGFTSRAVIDMGYHQDPPAERMPDKSLLDMRRKIFYCVYALDRSISMVHARAFSFTDASTNVGWPTPSSFGGKTAAAGDLFTGSEPALLLFQLRRAQSHWYQALFQSGPRPRPDAGSYVWHICEEMREWAEALPGTLSVEMRELFNLEVRYSFVYCLATSNAAPHLTDYDRLLIFEHTISYLESIHIVAHTSANGAFYTYHDALRVYFMANHLLAVLREAEGLLLTGVTIAPPPVEMGKPRPPPLRLGGGDNLRRSLGCLDRTTKTLAKFGDRWPDAASLKQSFDLISAETMDRLRMMWQGLQSPDHAGPFP